MLSIDEALAMIAKRLDSAIPDADANGGYVFPLEGDTALGMAEIPGNHLAAWTEVERSALSSPSAAEERAAEFMRLHFARLVKNLDIVAACGDGGELLLVTVQRPDTALDWLRAVNRLLNEAETVRKFMGGEKPSGARGMYGMGGGVMGVPGR